MSNYPKSLFNELVLQRVLECNLQRASEYVDQIEESKLLAASDEELLEHIVSKHYVEPLELYEDEKAMEHEEIKIDARNYPDRYASVPDRPCLIPGMIMRVLIPYSGDSLLWKCRPGSFDLNPPSANIIVNGVNGDGNYVEIAWETPMDNADVAEFKQIINTRIASIKKYISDMSGDITLHNNKIRIQAGSRIRERRARLGKHTEIAKALNIPLKKKPGSLDISKLPIKQRIVKPLPAPANKPEEPGIDDKWYEYILDVIRHEGRTFETTPTTYSVHDEEGLRDIILAPLNGHLKGEASGETFRKKGKTDIRIEDKDRAAFVAECKVWRGQKHVTEALDQLLSYLTWRDCKAALIVFNLRAAKFSELQAKLPEALQGHPNFIKAESVNQQGEWRFVFRSAEDEGRHIKVHVFLFDLYVAMKP